MTHDHACTSTPRTGGIQAIALHCFSVGQPCRVTHCVYFPIAAFDMYSVGEKKKIMKSCFIEIFYSHVNNYEFLDICWHLL